MPIFEFDENAHLLGEVNGVDTRRVSINVESTKLTLARVGGLVAIKYPTGAVEEWLIALVDRVTRSLGEGDRDSEMGKGSGESKKEVIEHEINMVQVVLIGTIKAKEGKKANVFSRSILIFPGIKEKCYVLDGENLQKFMAIISAGGAGEHSLAVGHYTLDPHAIAYIDGNKLFQRHAALLGSTGSGKSWTVATILERAKELPSANMLLFDLHGEYKSLKYARHLRVAGPDDLAGSGPDVLFLPYWLLNAEEMQAMFIDRSEFSAHNQVMIFQKEVTELKKLHLEELDKSDVLNSFTIDSPVPFPLIELIKRITEKNEERVQGERGLKQGEFYAQFSRLLIRLQSRINDRRYGFLFQAPEIFQQYEALHTIAGNLMDFTGKDNNRNQIKVIDFSEVPSEILPVIVSLVARLVYQVQFWMDREKRQPLVLVCDEAHLYLPKRGGLNPLEERALENFEKIAKEGRKYGVGLLVVSQRPSDVSETILSQCNNFIVLRLTNDRDQSVVKNLLPDSMESFADLLPILDIGEALIVGDAVLLPTRIKINPPGEDNRPDSVTMDFWKEWSQPDKSSDIVRAVENMRKQSRSKRKK